MEYSEAYIQYLKRGPFPEQIDPWVENGRYFRQIHSDILFSFLAQYHDSLLKKGYITSLDWTLQNGERTNAHIDIVPKLNLDLGIEIGVPDLNALFIREMSSRDFVTIFEIISPYSKIDNASIQAYLQQRDQWIGKKDVQFVELDLTRSEKRLDKRISGNPHAYNVTVYVKDVPHVYFIDYAHTLPRIALPLRNEVIAIELQTLYHAAYQQAFVAHNMLKDNFYTEANLPFPSLLTEVQIQDALETVDRWQEELKRLEGKF